jgi:N-methylhydantoinase A
MTTIRVATDVGGTFTDLVYFATDPATGAQTVRTAKTDTTPPDFETGVLKVLEKGGVDPAAIDFLAHGTTVVINALTERKGAKVGLITTEGFRDVLEIARGNRPDFFNLSYEKPRPFVERHLRREVPGRSTFLGEEQVPLDVSGVPAILADFQAEGVEAVAICLLHSYARPEQERALLAEVRRLWPGVPAVASHQITREWREYERTSTAVLSAYVQPTAERYLERLASGLADQGFRGSFYVMQSNCGVDTAERTRAIPITMVESGPASGVWGAAALGRLIGEPNVIALDIGGTTAKCSLIRDGEVTIMTDYWIERDRTSSGYPIMVPVVDLVEIGNGGGSIAWVDDLGKLHVGPQSAGADPGPVAYGRGGTEPTTTDANLILDRINRDYFCGGEITADMGAAEAAMDRLAGRLGVDRVAAARGVVRIANSNMVNALKLVSVNRGHDPREFTLVAFGGGGAMHACALARELGVSHVVIPDGASVFSAWGMMMSDLRRDYFVTRLTDFVPENAAPIAALLDEVETTAREQFAAEGIAADKVGFLRYGKFRYQNQEHSVEVLLPAGAIDAAAVAAITDDYHRAYEREYTYRLPAPVELVGVHVVASSEVGKLAPAEKPATGRGVEDARKPSRQVDFALEGVHETAIYDHALLEPGMWLAGPAVVEEAGMTVVIHPGDTAEMDRLGNIHIRVKEG